MQVQKGISNSGAEAFSGVIIHIFLLPHFNPKHISSLLSGGDNSPKRIFILPGICSGAGLATSYLCANWFPLSLGNRHDERIQNSGGYFRAVGLVILGGYGRPGSVAFFLFSVP